MQLDRQPKYDRYARGRINDELIALRRRIPSLSVKVMADAVSEIANIKGGIPHEYFYRLETIRDERWLDYIVDWLQRLHNPNIRAELNVDYKLHKLAAAQLDWETDVVSLGDWRKCIKLCEGWHHIGLYSEIMQVDEPPVSLLLAPQERPYFLALLVTARQEVPPDARLWVGIALPASRGRLRMMLRNDAIATTCEFTLWRGGGSPDLSEAANLLFDSDINDSHFIDKVMIERQISIVLKKHSDQILANRIAKRIYLEWANQEERDGQPA